MIARSASSRPQRLCAHTRAMAAEFMSGAWGRTLREAPCKCETHWQEDPAAALGGYVQAVKMIAEQAPVRIIAGEYISGSATFLEAANHRMPGTDISGTSHTTINFARLLREGYSGIRRRIQARLECPDEELSQEQQNFLQAMLACLQAAERWRQRYSEALMGKTAASEQFRVRYKRSIAALQHTPEKPPRNFHEAVQALWFAWSFQRLCGNWSGLGRLDLMLGPFLDADLAEDRITLAEAREILAHFWIKGCEWTGASTSHLGTSGDAQFYQNVVLGGVDATGLSVINNVTYLILDVIEELGISDYPVAVRISQKTPERLLRRIAEVQRFGGGIVAVYNEDLIMHALTEFGYSLEEARSFANDGCWEIIIPGRTMFGYCPIDMYGKLQDLLGVTSASGTIKEYPDFAALYSRYKAVMAAAVADFQRRADDYCLHDLPAPVLSLLVDDCIEKARGYHNRGARYTVWSPHAGGLPDVANALAVIQKLVYEEQRFSLTEFLQFLRRNWDGAEPLRREIRQRFPFYGNSAAAAQALLQRLFNDFTELVGQVKERNGVLRPAGISTFGRQIDWAAVRGAGAAGTFAGEYLANNFSPAPGTDREGPTAVLAAYCSVDFEKLPNGTALELTIPPETLLGESGIQTLISLYRTFIRLGGIFMHIDVVDTKILRAAQQHPERYGNLAVRISGWSARFATLSREWQEMIIERSGK